MSKTESVGRGIVLPIGVGLVVGLAADRALAKYFKELNQWARAALDGGIGIGFALVTRSICWQRAADLSNMNIADSAPEGEVLEEVKRRKKQGKHNLLGCVWPTVHPKDATEASHPLLAAVKVGGQIIYAHVRMPREPIEDRKKLWGWVMWEREHAPYQIFTPEGNLPVNKEDFEWIAGFSTALPEERQIHLLMVDDGGRTSYSAGTFQVNARYQEQLVMGATKEITPPHRYEQAFPVVPVILR